MKLYAQVRKEDGTIEKREVFWPEHDWTARLYTSIGLKAYIVSRKGDVLTNCFNDNGRIHVVCNNHRLGKGRLQCEFHAEIPNGLYPDGIEDLYEPQLLDIELVDGPGDCATQAEVDLMLPYIKGDTGDAFTYSDFTSEQKEELIAPIKESIDKAITDKQDKLRVTSDFDLSDNLLSLTEAGKTALFDSMWASIGGTKLDNGSYRMGATGKELTIEDAMVRYERNGFIKQWNAACGTYGRYSETTGYFELNGLTDITFEQAIAIYQAGRPNNAAESTSIYSHSSIRTNLPWTKPISSGCGEAFFACGNIETIRVTSTFNVTGLYCFFICPRLHTIFGSVTLTFSDDFKDCSGLVSVNARMNKQGATLSFRSCRLLDIDSVRYSVENSQPCTILLHPDAYSRIPDELHALAEEKQITLATT